MNIINSAHLKQNNGLEAVPTCLDSLELTELSWNAHVVYCDGMHVYNVNTQI